MANWEETVMSPEKIAKVLEDSPFALSHELITGIIDDVKRVAQKQAELTWHSRDKEVAEAKQRGRKEVLDWVKANIRWSSRETFNNSGFGTHDEEWGEILGSEWQAQLKAWGVSSE